jgi:hypothetical protein
MNKMKEPLKRLFDSNDKYNNIADEVDSKTMNAIKPIFQYYVDKGYSIRDIANIMSKVILDEELMQLLPECTQPGHSHG